MKRYLDAAVSTLKALPLHRKRLKILRKDCAGYELYNFPLYQTGAHPSDYQDIECTFAANNLLGVNGSDILDVGSYRRFVIGLAASYKLTTVDIRPRELVLQNETAITSDAKQLTMPDNSFDAVTSLSSLEHFGLGRYGDDFDLEADEKAFREFRRVLKPGGRLIFSTTITRGANAVVFSAHRIYTLDKIHALTRGMRPVEEMFYSRTLGRTCAHDEISDAPRSWDVYCGCWENSEND